MTLRMYTYIRPRASLLLSALLFFTVFGGVFAGGNSEKGNSSPFSTGEAPLMPGPPAESGPVALAIPGPVVSTPAAVPSGNFDRAETIMKALAAAYPDKIGPAEFRDGDWAVPLRGNWYYYAEGRLLPEEIREKAPEYDPQPFYTYPEDLPPWEAPDPEDSRRMREMMEQRRLHPAKRSQHFYDELWRAHNNEESWERVKQIRFLGHTVLVHYSILEELSLVEEQILKEATTNTAVRQWISGIKSIDGWNWRNIAATASRSFHSYGAAIDLLPKTLGGAETYWQWTARTIPDWWTVPYSKRLHPPPEIVKIFESFGFIWGGKWTTYDTMHFEYRPEILFFSRLPLSDLR